MPRLAADKTKEVRLGHAAAFATLSAADCTPPLSSLWHQSPNASGKLVPGAFCRVALYALERTKT